VTGKDGVDARPVGRERISTACAMPHDRFGCVERRAQREAQAVAGNGIKGCGGVANRQGRQRGIEQREGRTGGADGEPRVGPRAGNDAMRALPFEDSAERDVLWALEGKLEKVLPDVLAPDYNDRVEAARAAVRGISN
jgi:hypothetical protein